MWSFRLLPAFSGLTAHHPNFPVVHTSLSASALLSIRQSEAVPPAVTPPLRGADRRGAGALHACVALNGWPGSARWPERVEEVRRARVSRAALYLDPAAVPHQLALQTRSRSACLAKRYGRRCNQIKSSDEAGTLNAEYATNYKYETQRNLMNAC